MYQRRIRAISAKRDESSLSKIGLTVPTMTALGTSIKHLQRKDRGMQGQLSSKNTALALPLLEPMSPDEEAVTRLRLMAIVGLILELILPLYETIFPTRADWPAIQLHAIWFVLTLALLVATWCPAFVRMWKPAGLLFSTAMILCSGIWSIKGVSPAPFFFLLVLLPVGGACLPWGAQWQRGIAAICIIFGCVFASQLDWGSGPVLSGLSATGASIIGSLLFNQALTGQRERIDAYVKALSRSEEKFRKAFETSASLMAIFTVPESLIVDVNPAWERTFGISRAEAIGRSPVELGLVADGAAHMHWFASLKTGDMGALQAPVIHSGRRENSVYCVYSWSTLELNDRLCALVVGQDITARMRAEEKQRHNREAKIEEHLGALDELASSIAHDLNNSLNALRLNIELLRVEEKVQDDRGNRLDLLSRIVTDAHSKIGRLQDFARRRHGRPV
jgi:PAS domain S-box-containing protein